jgi:hypothetical protein
MKVLPPPRVLIGIQWGKPQPAVLRGFHDSLVQGARHIDNQEAVRMARATLLTL